MVLGIIVFLCASPSSEQVVFDLVLVVVVAEPHELLQLKCLSYASGAVTHLKRNNQSVPQI
jgi:hypothetical protein